MAGDSSVDMKTGTPLAIGAAAGGIVGKMMFQYLSNMFADKDMVGAVQAGCLTVSYTHLDVYKRQYQSSR